MSSSALYNLFILFLPASFLLIIHLYKLYIKLDGSFLGRSVREEMGFIREAPGIAGGGPPRVPVGTQLEVEWAEEERGIMGGKEEKRRQERQMKRRKEEKVERRGENQKEKMTSRKKNEA